MHELALFAGAGGGLLAGHLLGWRTVCAVEIDHYAASVLVKRQNEGYLPPFPVWDDVRTFDARAWRGLVDVVSGGFPCQDVSLAGDGAGVELGERSGLWREMARIVREVRPRFVFVENPAALSLRGLGRVLADLAEIGFDARWLVLGAADVGAPHVRERLWLLAYAHGYGQLEQTGEEPEIGDWSCHGGASLADPARPGLPLPGVPLTRNAYLDAQRGSPLELPVWPTEPDMGRVAHGVAARVDRIRTIGAGQVPRVAAVAWCLLMQGMKQDQQHRQEGKTHEQPVEPSPCLS